MQKMNKIISSIVSLAFLLNTVAADLALAQTPNVNTLAVGAKTDDILGTEFRDMRAISMWFRACAALIVRKGFHVNFDSIRDVKILPESAINGLEKTQIFRNEAVQDPSTGTIRIKVKRREGLSTKTYYIEYSREGVVRVYPEGKAPAPTKIVTSQSHAAAREAGIITGAAIIIAATNAWKRAAASKGSVSFTLKEFRDACVAKGFPANAKNVNYQIQQVLGLLVIEGYLERPSGEVYVLTVKGMAVLSHQVPQSIVNNLRLASDNPDLVESMVEAVSRLAIGGASESTRELDKRPAADTKAQATPAARTDAKIDHAELDSNVDVAETLRRLKGEKYGIKKLPATAGYSYIIFSSGYELTFEDKSRAGSLLSMTCRLYAPKDKEIASIRYKTDKFAEVQEKGASVVSDILDDLMRNSAARPAAVPADLTRFFTKVFSGEVEEGQLIVLPDAVKEIKPKIVTTSPAHTVQLALMKTGFTEVFTVIRKRRANNDASSGLSDNTKIAFTASARLSAIGDEAWDYVPYAEFSFLRFTNTPVQIFAKNNNGDVLVIEHAIRDMDDFTAAYEGKTWNWEMRLFPAGGVNDVKAGQSQLADFVKQVNLSHEESLEWLMKTIEEAPRNFKPTDVMAIINKMILPADLHGEYQILQSKELIQQNAVEKLLVKLFTENPAAWGRYKKYFLSKKYRRNKGPLGRFIEAQSHTKPEPKGPEQADPRSLKLEDLGLMKHSLEVVVLGGITSVEQLIGHTENELLSIRSPGKTTLNDIKVRLALQGLSLRKDSETFAPSAAKGRTEPGKSPGAAWLTITSSPIIGKAIEEKGYFLLAQHKQAWLKEAKKRGWGESISDSAIASDLYRHAESLKALKLIRIPNKGKPGEAYRIELTDLGKAAFKIAKAFAECQAMSDEEVKSLKLPKDADFKVIEVALEDARRWDSLMKRTRKILDPLKEEFGEKLFEEASTIDSLALAELERKGEYPAMSPVLEMALIGMGSDKPQKSLEGKKKKIVFDAFLAALEKAEPQNVKRARRKGINGYDIEEKSSSRLGRRLYHVSWILNRTSTGTWDVEVVWDANTIDGSIEIGLDGVGRLLDNQGGYKKNVTGSARPADGSSAAKKTRLEMPGATIFDPSSIDALRRAIRDPFGSKIDGQGLPIAASADSKGDQAKKVVPNTVTRILVVPSFANEPRYIGIDEKMLSDMIAENPRLRDELNQTAQIGSDMMMPSEANKEIAYRGFKFVTPTFNPFITSTELEGVCVVLIKVEGEIRIVLMQVDGDGKIVKSGIVVEPEHLYLSRERLEQGELTATVGESIDMTTQTLSYPVWQEYFQQEAFKFLNKGLSSEKASIKTYAPGYPDRKEVEVAIDKAGLRSLLKTFLLGRNTELAKELAVAVAEIMTDPTLDSDINREITAREFKLVTPTAVCLKSFYVYCILVRDGKRLIPVLMELKSDRVGNKEEELVTIGIVDGNALGFSSALLKDRDNFMASAGSPVFGETWAEYFKQLEQEQGAGLDKGASSGGRKQMQAALGMVMTDAAMATGLPFAVEGPVGLHRRIEEGILNGPTGAVVNKAYQMTVPGLLSDGGITPKKPAEAAAVTPAEDVRGLYENIKDTVRVTQDSVIVTDPAAFRAEVVDYLAFEAALSQNPDVRVAAQRILREAALSFNLKLVSIHNFYMAKRQDKWSNITVPAVNGRADVYHQFRQLFRAARENNMRTPVLELARSEIRYTAQDAAEFTAVSLAAAIKEGYEGLIFAQGDHYQVNKEKFAKGGEEREKELQAIETLIRKALLAGVYNIDLDPSTLVDESVLDAILLLENDFVDRYLAENPGLLKGLDDNGIKSLRRRLVDEIEMGKIKFIDAKERDAIGLLYLEMHRSNIEVTMRFVRYIRKLEKELNLPTVSIGIEERHIDNPNHKNNPSTVLGSTTLARAILGLCDAERLAGPSKISLQTGTMHGLGGEVDFGIYKRHLEFWKKIGINVFVQHGASTLEKHDFDKMREGDVGEVHLATEYQKMELGIVARMLPQLGERMAQYLDELMRKDPKLDKKFRAMWNLAFGDPTEALRSEENPGKRTSYNNLAALQANKEERADIIAEILGDSMPKGLKGTLKDLVKELSGQFKKELWNLPPAVRAAVDKAIYEEFSMIFAKLGANNTASIVEEILPFNAQPVVVAKRPDAMQNAVKTPSETWKDPKDLPPEKRVVMLISGGEAAGVNNYFALLARKLAAQGMSLELVKFGLDGLVKAKAEFDERRVWVDWKKAEKIMDMPGAAEGTARVKLGDPKHPEYMDNAVANLKGYCRTVIIIGGNDHIGEADNLAKRLKADGTEDTLVIALPKTIDRDTKVYPIGADTAGEHANELVRRASARARPGSGNCVVVQVMGRDMGYLAVRAGDQNDPTVVVAVPEYSYDPNTGETRVSLSDIVKAVGDRMALYGAATVVVSEGFRIKIPAEGPGYKAYIKKNPILAGIMLTNEFLKAKFNRFMNDPKARDPQGNFMVTELGIGDFIAEAISLEMGLVRDENLFLEDLGYSYRARQPNGLDRAIAENAATAAFRLITDEGARRDAISRGGVCIAAERAIKKMRDAAVKVMNLSDATGKVDLTDSGIYSKDELSGFNVLGAPGSSVGNLPRVSSAARSGAAHGYNLRVAVEAIGSQAESALDMKRPNVCVIARDDADEIIGKLKTMVPVSKADLYVMTRTFPATSYHLSFINEPLFEIINEAYRRYDKYGFLNLVISGSFRISEKDMLLPVLRKDPACRALIEAAKPDGKGNLIFGRRLVELLFTALQSEDVLKYLRALGLKSKKAMSGVRKNILGESLNRLPGEEDIPAPVPAAAAAPRTEAQEAVEALRHAYRTLVENVCDYHNLDLVKFPGAREIVKIALDAYYDEQSGALKAELIAPLRAKFVAAVESADPNNWAKAQRVFDDCKFNAETGERTILEGLSKILLRSGRKPSYADVELVRGEPSARFLRKRYQEAAKKFIENSKSKVRPELKILAYNVMYAFLEEFEEKYEHSGTAAEKANWAASRARVMVIELKRCLDEMGYSRTDVSIMLGDACYLISKLGLGEHPLVGIIRTALAGRNPAQALLKHGLPDVKIPAPRARRAAIGLMAREFTRDELLALKEGISIDTELLRDLPSISFPISYGYILRLSAILDFVIGVRHDVPEEIKIQLCDDALSLRSKDALLAEMPDTWSSDDAPTIVLKELPPEERAVADGLEADLLWILTDNKLDKLTFAQRKLPQGWSARLYKRALAKLCDASVSYNPAGGKAYLSRETGNVFEFGRAEEFGKNRFLISCRPEHPGKFPVYCAAIFFGGDEEGYASVKVYTLPEYALISEAKERLGISDFARAKPVTEAPAAAAEPPAYAAPAAPVAAAPKAVTTVKDLYALVSDEYTHNFGVEGIVVVDPQKDSAGQECAITLRGYGYKVALQPSVKDAVSFIRQSSGITNLVILVVNDGEKIPPATELEALGAGINIVPVYRRELSDIVHNDEMAATPVANAEMPPDVTAPAAPMAYGTAATLKTLYNSMMGNVPASSISRTIASAIASRGEVSPAERFETVLSVFKGMDDEGLCYAQALEALRGFIYQGDNNKLVAALQALQVSDVRPLEEGGLFHTEIGPVALAFFEFTADGVATRVRSSAPAAVPQMAGVPEGTSGLVEVLNPDGEVASSAPGAATTLNERYERIIKSVRRPLRVSLRYILSDLGGTVSNIQLVKNDLIKHGVIVTVSFGEREYQIGLYRDGWRNLVVDYTGNAEHAMSSRVSTSEWLLVETKNMVAFAKSRNLTTVSVAEPVRRPKLTERDIFRADRIAAWTNNAMIETDDMASIAGRFNKIFSAKYGFSMSYDPAKNEIAFERTGERVIFTSRPTQQALEAVFRKLFGGESESRPPLAEVVSEKPTVEPPAAAAPAARHKSSKEPFIKTTPPATGGAPGGWQSLSAAVRIDGQTPTTMPGSLRSGRPFARDENFGLTPLAADVPAGHEFERPKKPEEAPAASVASAAAALYASINTPTGIVPDQIGVIRGALAGDQLDVARLSEMVQHGDFNNNPALLGQVSAFLAEARTRAIEQATATPAAALETDAGKQALVPPGGDTSRDVTIRRLPPPFDAGLTQGKPAPNDAFVRNAVAVRLTRGATQPIMRQQLEDLKDTAREVGSEIPTATDTRFTLLVDSNLYGDEEFNKDQQGILTDGRYIGPANRFTLEKVNSANVENILAHVKDASRTIVQVSSSLSEADLAKLKEMAPDLRVIRIDTAGLRYDKELNDMERQLCRFDLYAMMLAARQLTKEDIDARDASRAYRLMMFFLSSHLKAGETVAVDDYLEALVKNELTVIIQCALSYKPATVYKAPEYHSVALTLISA